MTITLEQTATTPANALPALMQLMAGDEKHEQAATSTLDVIWVLYDRVLRVSAEAPNDPFRDRFLLSKGHGPQAYYAVLAAKGFIPTESLSTFGGFDSSLGHHPDRQLVRGVEISSGSLGHGLPIAVGVALGLRAKGLPDCRVVCLLGDGEFDEGSNQEAVAIAGRLRLDSLTAVVIDNASASKGWPGGIDSRFSVEGWSTATVNGRRHDEIEAALRAETGGQPRAVIATIKE